MTPLRNTIGERSLGETLAGWIKNEEYLKDVKDDIKDNIDKLAALRCFWKYVYGQYCYEKTFGSGMPLKEDKDIS